MAARHSNSVGAPRAVWWIVVGLAVVSVVAVLGIRWIGDSTTGCDERIPLVVDADPALAPALTEFVRTGLPQAGDDAACLRPEIRAAAPAAVMDRLVAADPVDRPDLWIPDSSMWLARTRAAASVVPDRGPSIAASPIVLAAPQRTADRAGWPERSPTWSDLLGGSSVTGVAQPAGSAAAALAVLGIERLQWRATDRARAIQAMTKHAFTESDDLFDHLPGGTAEPVLGVFPASEQAVVRHNDSAASADRSVVAVYPEVPTAWLDYPAVVLAQADERRDAAAVLQHALRSPAGAKVFAEHGFRSPDGKLSGHAAADKRVQASAPDRAPTPDAAAVTGVLQRWATFAATARIAVAIDVSRSMARPVRGTKATRMQVATRTVSEAIRLLRPNTRLTLWEFSTERDGDLPYRELAPWQPVLQHIRDGLPKRLPKVFSAPRGGTGLYDTTLAAFTEVQRGWDPSSLNLVLILTDGRNDNPGGLTRERLMAELRSLVDPKRPIHLIYVGLGADVDPNELRGIARATGGQVHLTPDIKRTRDLFFNILRGLAKGGG